MVVENKRSFSKDKKELAPFAFHFKAVNENFSENYAFRSYSKLLGALLQRPHELVRATVSIGDVFFDFPTFDLEASDMMSRLHVQDKFETEWLDELSRGSGELTQGFDIMVNNKVFVVVFDELSRKLASDIHVALSSEKTYLGFVSINPKINAHKFLYADALLPRFRLIGGQCLIFYDGFDKDSHQSLKKVLEKIGFSVDFELQSAG